MTQDGAALRLMADITRLHARRQPARTALIFEGVRTDYATLDRRASQVANGLRALDLPPQGRIAHLDKNSAAFYELLFGAAKANAVLVSVNWRLAAPEIAYVINDAAAEILFVGSEYFPVVEQIRDQLTTVRRIIAFDGGHAAWPSYDTWREAQAPADPALAIEAEDVCLQLYTSGTTGHPKGVQITNRNLMGLLGHAATQWHAFEPDTVNLAMLPAFHIGGCGWGICGFYAGVTTVLLREFDPAKVLEAIATYRVTTILFVPAMVLFMLQHPAIREADLSSLRTLVYGASPMPAELLKQALPVFACKFVQLYGLTETTGGVVLLGPEDHDPARPERLKSCGRPIAGVGLRIVDAAGHDLPPGQVGEILISGPQIMKGYWNRDEATRQAIRDGWFHTGDAGYRDAEGYLYIHDRVKDMIVSGGENIYPAEVENALFAHPAVADAAVIGVPDARWGEAVKAFVVLKPGRQATAGDLITLCRERIAGYKVPRSIEFVDALPRNPTGKILKRELRRPYWEGRERQVN